MPARALRQLQLVPSQPSGFASARRTQNAREGIEIRSSRCSRLTRRRPRWTNRKMPARALRRCGEISRSQEGLAWSVRITKMPARALRSLAGHGILHHRLQSLEKHKMPARALRHPGSIGVLAVALPAGANRKMPARALRLISVGV